MSQYTFNAVSTVHKKRSFFDLSRGVKTSMSVGTLYPIQCREVLPGDTFKESESHVVRLSSSFIRPVMDNYWMDVYNFFVPSRIIYDKFVNVMGENTESAWANTVEYSNPEYTTRQTVTSKSVADYLGLPLGVLPTGITSLPFRAFAMIYNEWFRNENIIDPMLIQKGTSTNNEQLNSNPWSPSNYTGMCPKISKKKDYFTSALPSPQKGNPVSINVVGGHLPLNSGITDQEGGLNVIFQSASQVPTNTLSHAAMYTSDGKRYGSSIGDDLSVIIDGYSGNNYLSAGTSPSSGSSNENLYLGAVAALGGAYADASGLQATNINDLRFATQLQRMLELDARSGSRYREYLLAHYGVDNADARMQIPEFLGGKRTPLNTQQVAQTSESTSNEALATLGAYSHSVGRSGYVKSFTEHGYVITVAAIRTMHTYQQGVEKMWSRLKRNDYYDPLFAYLGEQPIYTAQIYAADQQNFKDNVFGYNEAWAEYRYSPSIITGQMRTGATDSLDVYHFGDNYANAPVLSEEFINETPSFFNRTVAVDSAELDNFVVDFYFNTRAWHVMPTFSTPGLIDHTY